MRGASAAPAESAEQSGVAKINITPRENSAGAATRSSRSAATHVVPRFTAHTAAASRRHGAPLPQAPPPRPRNATRQSAHASPYPRQHAPPRLLRNAARHPTRPVCAHTWKGHQGAGSQPITGRLATCREACSGPCRKACSTCPEAAAGCPCRGQPRLSRRRAERVHAHAAAPRRSPRTAQRKRRGTCRAAAADLRLWPALRAGARQ